MNLYLASSFRGSGVADLILNDIAKKLKKPTSEIMISYITTAGNLHPVDQRTWIDEGREILQAHGCMVFDYDIEGKTEEQVGAELRDKDVIFVQGGNTFYLLVEMQKCNFEYVLKQLLDKGKFYIGESAGSIVAANDIRASGDLTTDKPLSSELKDYHGLGLVNFLIRPHWNNARKKEVYLEVLREKLDKAYDIRQPLIFLNDNQLVYVESDKFQIWEG